MKGKIGLVFTETGQAEVEIPEEKDAKHSTVPSSDREICGRKREWEWEYGTKLLIWMARENKLGATSLWVKDKKFSKMQNNREKNLIVYRLNKS